jgi:hypothetical protein
MHGLNGTEEQRTLSSAGEIGTVLSDLFGIEVPDEMAFAAKLAQLGWPDFVAG